MTPGFRLKSFLIPCGLVLILFTFVYSPLPAAYNTHREAVVSGIADFAKASCRPSAEWHPPSLDTVNSKYAFATFLAGKTDDADDGAAGVNEHYFIATRIMVYQLLHAQETRSRNESIPVLVLVTDHVPEKKRERLRRDGAIVVPAEYVRADWVKTDTSTWEDVMTKLRLWELTQFERICFLDGDTVLIQPLEGVFHDPAVTARATSREAEIYDNEAVLPHNYSFAGVPEMRREHHFPPVESEGDFPDVNYLNAGFFVFEPSLSILDYYLSLMNTAGKFNPQLPEQNLLNYAHRRGGNMPWLQLDNTWNMHYPTMDDVHKGVKSLHDKWWAPENNEMRPYLESWRWRMEGYYEAMDARDAR
jgi:alpha-N-acetylglucosamine transferase